MSVFRPTLYRVVLGLLMLSVIFCAQLTFAKSNLSTQADPFGTMDVQLAGFGDFSHTFEMSFSKFTDVDYAKEAFNWAIGGEVLFKISSVYTSHYEFGVVLSDGSDCYTSGAFEDDHYKDKTATSTKFELNINLLECNGIEEPIDGSQIVSHWFKLYFHPYKLGNDQKRDEIIFTNLWVWSDKTSHQWDPPTPLPLKFQHAPTLQVNSDTYPDYVTFYEQPQALPETPLSTPETENTPPSSSSSSSSSLSTPCSQLITPTSSSYSGINNVLETRSFKIQFPQITQDIAFVSENHYFELKTNATLASSDPMFFLNHKEGAQTQEEGAKCKFNDQDVFAILATSDVVDSTVIHFILKSTFTTIPKQTKLTIDCGNDIVVQLDAAQYLTLQYDFIYVQPPTQQQSQQIQQIQQIHENHEKTKKAEKPEEKTEKFQIQGPSRSPINPRPNPNPNFPFSSSSEQFQFQEVVFSPSSIPDRIWVQSWVQRSWKIDPNPDRDHEDEIRHSFHIVSSLTSKYTPMTNITIDTIPTTVGDKFFLQMQFSTAYVQTRIQHCLIYLLASYSVKGKDGKADTVVVKSVAPGMVQLDRSIGQDIQFPAGPEGHEGVSDFQIDVELFPEEINGDWGLVDFALIELKTNKAYVLSREELLAIHFVYNTDASLPTPEKDGKPAENALSVNYYSASSMKRFSSDKDRKNWSETSRQFDIKINNFRPEYSYDQLIVMQSGSAPQNGVNHATETFFISWPVDSKSEPLKCPVISYDEKTKDESNEEYGNVEIHWSSKINPFLVLDLQTLKKPFTVGSTFTIYCPDVWIEVREATGNTGKLNWNWAAVVPVKGTAELFDSAVFMTSIQKKPLEDGTEGDENPYAYNQEEKPNKTKFIFFGVMIGVVLVLIALYFGVRAYKAKRAQPQTVQPTGLLGESEYAQMD